MKTNPTIDFLNISAPRNSDMTADTYASRHARCQLFGRRDRGSSLRSLAHLGVCLTARQSRKRG
jgi:hypothetical protein